MKADEYTVDPSMIIAGEARPWAEEPGRLA
jgi:hypothetical protein